MNHLVQRAAGVDEQYKFCYDMLFAGHLCIIAASAAAECWYWRCFDESESSSIAISALRQQGPSDVNQRPQTPLHTIQRPLKPPKLSKNAQKENVKRVTLSSSGGKAAG